jgi:Spy/CpxP family protein refolding chaperone
MKRLLCLGILSLAISVAGAAQDQPQTKKQPQQPEARKALPQQPAPGGGMMCQCPCMMQGPGPMGQGPSGPGMMGPGGGMMGGGQGAMRPWMGDAQRRRFGLRRFAPGQGLGPAPQGVPGGPGVRGQRGPGSQAGPGGPNPPMFNQRLGPELNLTEQQQSRLREMGVEQQKKAIRLRADIQTKEIELHELLRAANPDRAAINAKIDEIGVLKAQTEKDSVAQRLAFEQLLTQEQKQKLRQRPGTGERQRQATPQQRPGQKPAPPQIQ